MKKRTSWKDVPKDYRRDYKKEFLNFLAMVAICAGTIGIMLLLFIIAG